MRLNLQAAKIPAFEERMSNFPDWMHPYYFNDNVITGYYKYRGVPANLTFVNSKSPPETIQRMREAYAAEDFSHRSKFHDKIVGHMPGREQMTALDISSATGQFSLALSDRGFKKVIASEIRREQVEQFKMILDSAEDQRYRDRITAINDPVSADDPSFPDRYKDMAVDCAFSMGLLYHLTNPIQHLVNLHTIAQKYAVIFTMTHSNPFAQNKWTLTLEDPAWITKATSGISWTPFFLELPKLLKSVGFKSVKVLSPDLFEKNFVPPARAGSAFVAKTLIELAALKAGVRIGAQKNLAPEYYRHTQLNPNYYAYLCEK